MEPSGERVDIAPRWKRWAAGLIDSVPIVLLSLPLLGPQRGEVGGRRRWVRDLATRAMIGAYQVSTTAVAGQTFGQWAVGIRVVDQWTWATPTLRQLLLRWATTSLPQDLSALLPISAQEKRALAAVRELQLEIERLRQQHERNRRAFNRALMSLYESHRVNALHACLPSLLRVLPGLAWSCAVHGPALRGPLHQGLHDRIARTVVVDDHAHTSGSR